MPLTDGLLGAAHPSDLCAMVLLEIASELDGQLEVVTEVPEDTLGFSQYGRLPHIPSLIRIASWDERCSGFEESSAPRFESSSGASTYCKEGSETLRAKGRRSASETPMPGHCARPYEGFCRQTGSSRDQ